MFEKFQQLKKLKQLRDQALTMQKALSQILITKEKDGVKVVLSADQKIQRLTIDGEERNDIKELVNDALKDSQKEAAKKLQDMGGGLSGLLGGMQ